MERKLRFGSLFAGVGGFDLGFIQAGFEPAWVAEFDEDASKVLAHHWPEVENYGDVRRVAKDSASRVDVLVGGFPCQDISLAGKRKGLEGERSGLWHEFARIIEELHPKWVVAENVFGLYSSNAGNDFAVVLQGLADRGYDVGWRCFDSQFFSLAQRRKRVFIVGCLGGGTSAFEILFESDSVPWDTLPQLEAGKDSAGGSPRCAAGSGETGRSIGFLQGQSNENIVEGMPTLTVRTRNLAMAPEKRPVIDSCYHSVSDEVAPTVRAGTGADTDTNVLATTAPPPERDITVLDTYNQTTSKDVTPTLAASGGGHPPVMEEIQLLDGDMAKTLSAQRGSNQDNYVIKPVVRRLMPIEYERLQGFPDGWTDLGGTKDGPRYKQMGNAVSPPVAHWIARRIMAFETHHKK